MEQSLVIYKQQYPFQVTPLNLYQKMDRIMILSLETSLAHDGVINQHLDKAIISPHQNWIITQNCGQIYYLPKVGQEIEISTYLIRANRFFVERQFQVWQDKQLCLTLQIQFAVLDLQERQIAKVDPKPLKELVVAQEQANQKSKFRPISDFSQENTQAIQITTSDIDLNRHVNNLVYLRWGLEHLPDLLLADYHLDSFYIKYGSELLADHEVILTTYSSDQAKGDDMVICQQVIENLTLNKEAARFETVWQEN